MEKKELLKLFKYYKGEEKNPYQTDSDKGWFWYGESMFMSTGQSLEDWERRAKICAKLSGKALQSASKLTDQQLGIVLYINTLFIKWCPMEDADFFSTIKRRFMIEGMFMGEHFTYDGIIESVGEYPSSRREGDKVWMGKTEYGFVYACYSDQGEPLVLSTFYPDDMLRFTSPYKRTEKENIKWSKSIPIPQMCAGAIALRSEELRRMSQESGSMIEYGSDYVKKMIESL